MGFLEQDRVFGARADHLRRRAARRERLHRAVDDPGAGGVHVLDAGKVDQHLVSAFGVGDQLVGPLLEARAGVDGPAAAQVQPDPGGGPLAGDGGGDRH